MVGSKAEERPLDIVALLVLMLCKWLTTLTGSIKNTDVYQVFVIGNL